MLFRSKLLRNLGVKDQKRKLVLLLCFFAVALSIPMSVLGIKGFKEFQKDIFYYHVWGTKNIYHQVVSEHNRHFKAEQNRPIDDYQFFKLRNKHKSSKSGSMLSPLASDPNSSPIPGLLSYFQVNQAGELTCPLLPFSKYKKKQDPHLLTLLDANEIKLRMQIKDQIYPVLEKSGFLPGKGKARGENAYEQRRGTMDDPQKVKFDNSGIPHNINKVSTFKSRRTDDGHLVFFREIQNERNRVIQGFIVNEREFLFERIKHYFEEFDFKTDVFLRITYKDTHLTSMLHEDLENGQSKITEHKSSKQDKQIHVHKFRLPQPFENYTLTYSVDTLPLGKNTITGGVFLLIVIGIMAIGLITFYRLGIQQINLNEERLNFVSSVSHELKTPLTSIIMYADMLRSNMFNNKEKQNEYYNYIFFEGERLGRLISNVLKLSKLGRDESDIQLEYVSLPSAIDIIRSKTSTLLENSAFELHIEYEDDISSKNDILIDRDAFTQVMINLVDNAVKFTEQAASSDNTSLNKRIDIRISRCKDDVRKACIGVRDYGPGIAKEDAKHIFKSFYRAGNELTRKTKGTGMGLTLVSELTHVMGGSIEFRNQQPGVEFLVTFQLKTHIA